MAILKRLDDETYCVLEITPVPPVVGGPENSYDIRLTCDGETLVEMRKDEGENILGHAEMYALARAFKFVSLLEGVRLPFSLWVSKDPGDAELAMLDQPLMGEFVDWMLFHFEIIDLRKRDLAEPLLCDITAIFEPDPHSELRCPPWRAYTLRHPVKDVVAFGNQLIVEMDTARRQRIELGIALEGEELYVLGLSLDG